MSADVPEGIDLLGANLDDLQSDIVIGDDTISGVLNFVSDYSGFSSKVEEQSGNYLALHITVPQYEDAVITVELIGGSLGKPVTLDEDKTIILRITDPDNQSVKIVATKDNKVVTKTYALTGIELKNE